MSLKFYKKNQTIRLGFRERYKIINFKWTKRIKEKIIAYRNKGCW